MWKIAGILITGGLASIGVLMSGEANPGVEAVMYIPDENKFCELPKLPEARMTHTMEVVDGTPVICGGAKQQHEIDVATGTSCMQFSPVSAEGEWKTGYATLTCPRTKHTSWVTCDGKMVQLGGGNCFTGETVPSSTKFNLPYRQAKRSLFETPLNNPLCTLFDPLNISCFSLYSFGTSNLLKTPKDTELIKMSPISYLLLTSEKNFK